MEQNEKKYEQFIKWMNGKSDFNGFTLSEVEFAKQMFELLEDYPSFKNKLSQSGCSKQNIFNSIHQYLKEIAK